jgi:hypothetical protein
MECLDERPPRLPLHIAAEELQAPVGSASGSPQKPYEFSPQLMQRK